MTAGVSFRSSSSVLRTASSSQCTSSSSNSRNSRGCLFFRSSSSLSSSQSVVERDGSRRIGRGKKFVAFASSSSNDDNKTSESLQSSSVFLLGLMGTGKTTVGKKLADALGYGYFDTDQLIEQICKQKVHEIFEEDGEEGFRETESAILAEVASYKRVVVSTGGGIVTVRNNWMHLHNGVTVCLQGDHRTLARRVHKDGVGARPLLKECLSEEDEEAQITKIEEKIQSLWRDRGKMYAECDIAVSVNGEEDEAYGASVETIVERICKSIDKRLREDGKQEKLRKGPEVGDIEVKDLKTGERIDKID